MNDSRGSRAALALHAPEAATRASRRSPLLPRWTSLASGLALCAGLVGCGAAQTPACDTTQAITLHVHPAKHLNPDRTGLPRSVVVRVYQLGDARAFTSSPFDRVWAGADGLPKPEQVIALPGRNQVHSLQRDPGAQYLAVAANFRERGGGSDGRALVRLPAPQKVCGHWPLDNTAPIEITLADYGVHLR